MRGIVQKAEGQEQSSSVVDASLKEAPDTAPRAAKTIARDRSRLSISPAVSKRTFLIPENFTLMMPIFLLGILIPSISAWTFPSTPVIALTAIASALSLASPKFVEYERAKGQPLFKRVGAYLLCVGLSMGCFGYAMGIWLDAHDSSVRAAIGGMICMSTIAAILHAQHLRSMLPSLLICWGFIAVREGSFASLGLYVGGVAIALVFAWRQVEEEKAIRLSEFDEARRRTRAEDILRDYEETGQGWFWETDRRGLLTYISPIAAESIGSIAKDLMGRPLTALFNLKDRGVEYERTLNFHISAKSAFHDVAVRAATQQEERWWSVSGRPIYDEFDNFMGFRGSGTDLTEKKRSQDQASRLALFDSLTSLANRLQMSQELEKILKAPQEQHRVCSVFLLDLDRFKQVNDTLGHPAGDALLKQVSQRLERTVGQMGRVGRLGGDEFKVIIPGRVEKQRLIYLAQEIIHQLSQPYSIEGHQVIIGASIGIATAPENGETTEEVIRNADLALYAAKDAGRGRFHFYADSLHNEAQERRALENDLREALVKGALELHYQPIVRLEDNQITGFESLIRWNHQQHGFISPEKFVSIAEDAGLIESMGEWALRTACFQLAAWPEEIRVAVNVSPLQFANPKLPALVSNAIVAAGIDPSRLELEITESVFLNDDDSTDATFAALKKIGVRLALDDFGTGYSSLGYLKKAPFDKIKIDQSFVRGATQEGSRNAAIIVSISSLAGSLGMDTTAEGVETFDELDLVKECGCSHVQGYIFDKPMPAQQASARLSQGFTAHPSGPKSAREPRHKLFRKVILDHSGQKYQGVIRNISTRGAMVEGLWNVPTGTVFEIWLSQTTTISATTRWGIDDRMGVEFASRLEIEPDGAIPAIAGKPPVLLENETREAG